MEKLKSAQEVTCCLRYPTSPSDSASQVLSPLVFTTDLLLLLGSEVIGDIEGLSNLLWRLALDYVGDGLATNIKEGLDIEIVSSLRGDCQYRTQRLP
jgi:hypothetical protein